MEKTIVDELREIEAKVSALIRRLEAENKAVTATVAEIRRLAVLEEIFKKGGSVTPDEISELARKYGKTPSSCAGYYSGNAPSMSASADKKTRVLTDTGKRIVQETREKWGNDWLDRLPMDVIRNAYTKVAEVSF